MCSLPLRSVLSSGSNLGVECRLPLLSVDPDIAALEGTEGNNSHHHFLGTVKVRHACECVFVCVCITRILCFSLRPHCSKCL